MVNRVLLYSAEMFAVSTAYVLYSQPVLQQLSRAVTTLKAPDQVT